MPRRSFLPDLPEPLEDRLQHRRGNSHAGVADAEPEQPSRRFDPDHDVPAGRSELDRVRDEVGEDLKQPVVIERREERTGRNLRGRETPFSRAAGWNVSVASVTRAAASPSTGTMASLPASMLVTSTRSPIRRFIRATYRRMRVGGGRDMRLRLVVARPQQLQAENDAVEEVADVVGDHAQEVVTVRDGVVGAVAFGQEVGIGGRPLVHEQRGQRVRLFLAVAVAERRPRGAFHADDAVGLWPFRRRRHPPPPAAAPGATPGPP